MGTRGAYGYRMNDEDKIVYNHFDSYISGGLGEDIMTFCSLHTTDEMVESFTFMFAIKEDKKPTKKQIKECAAWTDMSVTGSKEPNWYQLLRKTQGKLEAYLENGIPYYVDYKDFLKNSLFCEWAYIINLDTKKLEIYSGFNKKPVGDGRYASLQIDDEKDYYGVVLQKEIDLTFLYELNEDRIKEICKKISKEIEEKINREYEKEKIKV